jgi:hypothetical protein
MKNIILPKIKELQNLDLHETLNRMEIAAKKHQEHVLLGEADIDAELYFI